jgi:hypothetical protein
VDDTFEQKDGKLFIGQVKVPGHPGFQMFAGDNASASAKSEGDYRDGFYQAIAAMLSSIQRSDKYSRGYQHGVAELCLMIKAKGRLSASDLESWVEGMGRRWLNEVPKDIRALPPTLT